MHFPLQSSFHTLEVCTFYTYTESVCSSFLDTKIGLLLKISLIYSTMNYPVISLEFFVYINICRFCKMYYISFVLLILQTSGVRTLLLVLLILTANLFLCCYSLPIMNTYKIHVNKSYLQQKSPNLQYFSMGHS